MKDIDFGSIITFSLVFILIFMIVRFAFNRFGLGCQGWDLLVDALIASTFFYLVGDEKKDNK